MPCAYFSYELSAAFRGLLHLTALISAMAVDDEGFDSVDSSGISSMDFGRHCRFSNEIHRLRVPSPGYACDFKKQYA
ncbi:hypothetical protein BDQ12DRAFT_152585 [Crucibulum laeve]|uniref:Secreted protein n=1 Tax=Crucibulum laeve TaxID=68775 RepID=A0A5C3LXY2_9AGAR|nr:hypothetical protein BDQ12DRAFT_152585 [Crucibulum laeve]